MPPRPFLGALSVLTACAALGVPAAHAGSVVIGSDLTAPATIAHAHPVDAAFWPTQVRGAAATVPEAAQVTEIRVKGIAVPTQGAAPPLTEVHFQDLIPHADGSVTASQTSGPMNLPAGGDPNQITSFAPVNLCAHPGDVVDFNDEGGYDPAGYPNGVPYEIFGQAATSTTAFFSKGNETNNDMSWAPVAPDGGMLQGEELLMQVVLATGNDIGGACRYFLHLGAPTTTPPATTPPSTTPPAATPPAARALKIRALLIHVAHAKHTLAPVVYCPGDGPACTGKGTLTYRGKVIASGRLDAPPKSNTRIPMKLSARTYRLLVRAKGRTLRVTFKVVSSLGTYRQAIKLKG